MRHPRKPQAKVRIENCEAREWVKWDFAKVPSKEREHCFLYEYCLEIPEIVAEVENYRAREKERVALEEKAKIWELVEALRRRKDEESAGEQLLRFSRANPELMEARRTRLNPQVVFLLDCANFPGKHWQQLSADERRKEAESFVVDLGLWRRSHGAKSKLALVLPEEALDFLKRRVPKTPSKTWNLTEDDGWEEIVTVRLDWNRSTTELMKDFAELVEKQLRADRVPFQKTRDVPSRTTPPDAALKKLAAARLLRAYEEALKRGVELNDATGVPIELYAEPSDWLRAARKAEEIRQALSGRLLMVERGRGASSTFAVPRGPIRD